MLRPRPPRRSRVVIAFIALTALLGATAPAALANGGQGASLGANPYSPAYGHPYRHGVVPTIAGLQQMQAWARSAGHSPFGSSKPLTYGGGIDGIGVTTGAEKVYLVFYGSQWGTQGTNSTGDVTLSGDPSGEAPYLQELIKGLGTNGELWSGVMTQYCQGIATGAQSCPSSNAYHVAYPSGALAGVWVDEGAPSPSQATAAQLGQEAVNAAGHFGNTTAAANRDAQYVILSPTGTHPDGFNTPSGQFCAWHDWNGDSYVGVSSPYGDVAFTNMPYVTDMGTSCGQNFVNSGSSGTLDGVSIVEGHEYAETITDQNPAGGWTDSSGNETGDKCAWILPGTTGGAFDLGLGTGSFAMQTTWANDDNSGSGGCEGSHPIVTDPSTAAPTVTGISPTSGPATGGTTVTITGSGFTTGATVDFGTTASANVTFVSSTSITATSPAGTAGTTVDVTVTTSNGTSSKSSADQFTYLATHGHGHH